MSTPSKGRGRRAPAPSTPPPPNPPQAPPPTMSDAEAANLAEQADALLTRLYMGHQLFPSPAVSMVRIDLRAIAAKGKEVPRG